MFDILNSTHDKKMMFVERVTIFIQRAMKYIHLLPKTKSEYIKIINEEPTSNIIKSNNEIIDNSSLLFKKEELDNNVINSSSFDNNIKDNNIHPINSFYLTNAIPFSPIKQTITDRTKDKINKNIKENKIEENSIDINKYFDNDQHYWISNYLFILSTIMSKKDKEILEYIHFHLPELEYYLYIIGGIGNLLIIYLREYLKIVFFHILYFHHYIKYQNFMKE